MNNDSHRRNLGSHSHLEPGVRLVARRFEMLGFRTYRGCEGHPAAGASGLELRHVGIVPSDDSERVMPAASLQRLAAAANSAAVGRSRVQVEVREGDRCFDSSSPRAIDIVFAPRSDLAPRDYFEHLASTYAEFCDRLEPDCGRRPARRPLRNGVAADVSGESAGGELLWAIRHFYDTALSWHCKEPVTSPASDGIAAKALDLHALNFGLWHHEDAVRRPGVADGEVARRKRRIDHLNAERNAAVEDIDSTVLERVTSNAGAPLHTETPGTIVDRLSILTLRLLHTNRAQDPGAHLAVLGEQYDDLYRGLQRMLTDLEAGGVRIKVYRQFKAVGQRGHCALFETRDT
ncbi:hypothetical protein MSAS_33350 [Mycobacterium saskatchewanense]|uniref:Uncharacterized protein n=1 Tax=Mycobacterium saskatchewanense TaxID=220927 RepID=A0AAJ3NV94_9MYCO|nr:DUF4254 domain-containing protein [Mycobacterium saskatchewanense]ORW74225.1 hypothetical protein AWC23_05425 [Mycobacterium saskatchewanense]BBX64161.1 hypothetical protein MSAS_33350 [Mycobacterium saskatchewanense]